jgi:hypothetical protein
MGWVVNATSRPLYPRERTGIHFIGGGVGPGPIWTGAENPTHTGIRSPDRPASSESLNDWAIPAHNTPRFIPINLYVYL